MPLALVRRMPPGRVGDERARGVEVADEAARRRRRAPSVHETYGVLPKNVMSGVPASSFGRRDRVAAVEQLEVVAADQARDEDRVVAADVLRPRRPTGRSARPASACPAATRGSSASLPATLFSEQASSAVGRRGAVAEVVRAGRVERRWSGPAVPLPTAASEAAVGVRVRDDLGREDLLVVAQADVARVLLVPDGPRDGVARAGERDVGLDAVAARVDVQRRVAGRRRAAVLGEPVEADLLPAEVADAALRRTA